MEETEKGGMKRKRRGGGFYQSERFDSAEKVTLGKTKRILIQTSHSPPPAPHPPQQELPVQALKKTLIFRRLLEPKLISAQNDTVFV